jgi:hypothetical protein
MRISYVEAQPMPKVARMRRQAQARSRQQAARLLALLLAGSLLANGLQALWHLAYAEDAEKAMSMLRADLRQAQDEVMDAQLKLSAYELEERRNLPQD